MNEELKRKLISEIDKSGYFHEQSVTEKLIKKDVTVFPNFRFQNSEGKNCEIDAYAVLTSREEEEKWHSEVHLNLVVECKSSSSKPWVFFEDLDVRYMFGLGGKITYSSDVKIKPDYYSLLAGCNNTSLAKHHFNNPNIPKARTYFEAFSKEGGKEIYQGTLNLFDTLNYFKLLRDKPNKTSIYKKTSLTTFYNPVIVFKGILIFVSKINDEISLKEVPHILLRANDFNCIGADYPTGKEIVIDIIQDEYFDEYIDLCIEELPLFYTHLVQIEKAGWLVEAKSEK